MPELTIARDIEREWREADPSWPGKARPNEPGLRYKSLMEAPNIKRVQYEPEHFEAPHSHNDDEIIYLLAGQIYLGDRVVAAGDCLFVPKNTRYSLRAGPQGAEFVRLGFQLGLPD